jgi:hypothetical protein
MRTSLRGWRGQNGAVETGRPKPSCNTTPAAENIAALERYLSVAAAASGPDSPHKTGPSRRLVGAFCRSAANRLVRTAESAKVGPRSTIGMLAMGSQIQLPDPIAAVFITKLVETTIGRIGGEIAREWRDARLHVRILLPLSALRS